MTLLLFLKPHQTTYLRRMIDDAELDTKRSRRKVFDIKEKNRKRVAIEVKKSAETVRMRETAIKEQRRADDDSRAMRIRRSNEMLLRLLMEEDLL